MIAIPTLAPAPASTPAPMHQPQFRFLIVHSVILIFISFPPS